MKNESYSYVSKLVKISLQTIFLFFSFSLKAQIDCSSGPSPQIITDVINNCQEIKGLNEHKPDDCIHVCVNTPINYEGIISAGSTVEWQVAGGTIISGVNTNPVSVEWTSVGNGSIILTEVDTNGCVGTTELCIVIDDGPSADYTAFPEINNNVINICEGGEVFFSDNSTDDVVAWEWDFGDGSFSNLESPNHIFDSPGGVFDVSLTVYNDCGCSNTKTVQVIVNSGWTPIIECISTTCKNNEGVYSVTNLADCPGATFEWTVQNGTISNPTSNPVTVNWGAGAIGYLGVSVEGCGTICPATSYVNVPIIGAIGSIYGPTIVCVGDVVQFSVPYQPGSIFEWVVDGNFYSDEINTIDYSWASPGSHSVEIDITSLGVICPENTEHITLHVEVLPKFDFEIENMICSGSNVPVTFINNPGSSVSFEAYDNTGTFIQTLSYNNSEIIANTLPPGTYQIVASATGYCSNPVQALTVVEPTVDPLITAVTGNFEVCPNSIEQYEYDVPANMVPTWTVTGGVIIGNPSSDVVVVEWDGSGNYQLFISQVDINNIDCPSNAVAINISQFITSPLIINTTPIGGITDFCSDGTQIFEAGPDLSNVSDFNWSIEPDFAGSILSGNHTSTINVQFHAYDGIATIKLDADICETSEHSELEINIHNFNVAIGSYPSTVCQNDSETFTASVPGLPLGTSVTYAWFIDGIPAGSTGNLTFSNAGTATVTVTATLNGGSCDGRVLTDIVSVVVIPSPVANISAPNGNIYTGTNLPLIASAQIDPNNPTATYSYLWSTGSTSNTAIATGIGTYYVTVTNNTTMCSTVDNIGIYPPDSAGFCTGYTMNISESCGEVTVSLSPSTPDVTWTFGDQTSAILGAGPHIHNYTHSGVYFVTAKIETSPNVFCIVQESVTVEFIPQFISNFECGSANNMITHLIDQTDFIVPSSSLSYTWTIPSGSSIISGSLTTPLLDIDFGSLPSPQNITLTVSDPGGSCTYSEMVDFPSPIVADFTFQDSSCINTDVLFQTAQFGYGSDVSYSWDFGDGAASNLSEPSRSFSSSGNQNVSLTLIDEYGCNSTITDSVYIQASPYAGGIMITPQDTTFCAGNEIDLVYTPLSTGEIYTWTQDINTDLGNNAPVLPNVGTTGLYQLYVVNDIGCDAMSDLNQVVVTPVPFANIRGQDSYCYGDQVKLIAFAGDGVSYAWSVNGSVISETSYTLEFIAGQYIYSDGTVIQVEITDNATGCSVLSDPFNLNVLNGPSISVTTANNCSPAEFTVSSTGTIPVAQYVWSNGNLGSNSTYYSGDAGSVVAYSNDGCSTTVDFNVHEGPDVSNIAVGCYCLDKKNAEWHFSPVGSGYTYYVEEVGVGTTVTTDPDFVFPNSGIYTVTVVDAYGCSTTTEPIIIDLDNCKKCDFKLEYKDVECLGYDVVLGGFLYEFSVNYYNIGGAGLNGISASSPQVSVNAGSISPSSIAGGSSGTITGTFVGNPGQTDICILIEGAGAEGLICKDEFCIKDKLPECKDCEGCHLRLKDPKVNCINYVDGRNYFTFSMQYYNQGCPLIDMIWIIENEEFELTLDNNYIASNSTGFITGDMYLPKEVSGWIKFVLVGINPYTGKKCEYIVEFYIPKCKYDYKCEKVKVLESSVSYYGINDAWSNQLYEFDITLDCPISDGDVMIFPLENQTENQVSQLNVVTTGNTYHLTGLLTDFPVFNEKVCFYIAVYKDGKFCHTKECVEVRYQFSNRLTDNSELNYFTENKLSLAPNPASTKIDVAFDLDIEKSSFVEVRVFNQLGQVVHHFKGLNSELILPIDVSADESGLYYIALLVNGKLKGVSRYIVEK